MLSKRAKYGLKALLLLEREADRGAILIGEISIRERIPKKFLESILLTLKHHGVVQSRKGKGGGYLLGRRGSAISLGEVVRVLDGPLAPIPCVSHTAYARCEECPDEETCAVRLAMKDVRDATAAILDGTTLSAVNARTRQTNRSSSSVVKAATRTILLLMVGFSTVAARAQAQVAPPAKDGVHVSTTWTDGVTIETEGGDNRFQFGALLQADGRFDLQDPGHAVTDTFVMRRVRPIIQGRIARYFDFRVVPDFGNGNVVLFDASFDTRFSSATRVRVGKDKTPIGLEQLQPDFALMFTERALATNLVPNRDVGVQLLGDVRSGVLSYAAGVFNGVPDASNGDIDTNDGKDFVGRVAIRPFQGSSARAALRQAGLAFAGSDGDQSGALPVFRTSAQQVIYSYSAASTADGRRTRISPGAFIYYKRFGGFGEYVWSSQHVRNATRSDELTNEAYEITASLVLTGENATDRGVTPHERFDPNHHHWGAFQLAARFSSLAIDPDAIALGFAAATANSHARAAGVGLNWYLTTFVKYMLDYERTAMTGGAPDRTEHALLFRLQLSVQPR
jgi:phosphate-selective porin OprO/OprP